MPARPVPADDASDPARRFIARLLELPVEEWRRIGQLYGYERALPLLPALDAANAAVRRLDAHAALREHAERIARHVRRLKDVPDLSETDRAHLREAGILAEGAVTALLVRGAIDARQFAALFAPFRQAVTLRDLQAVTPRDRKK